GGSRIRTHGARKRPTVFKTAAFGRSAIPPSSLFYNLPAGFSTCFAAGDRGGKAGRLNTLPLHEAARPRQASAECGEHDELPLRDGPIPHRFIERYGDSGGRDVAVPLDGHVDLVHRYLE